MDFFNDVIDWLVQELDSRFSETTSQLLFAQPLSIQENHISGFQWADFDELSQNIS